LRAGRTLRCSCLLATVCSGESAEICRRGQRACSCLLATVCSGESAEICRRGLPPGTARLLLFASDGLSGRERRNLPPGTARMQGARQRPTARQEVEAPGPESYSAGRPQDCKTRQDSTTASAEPAARRDAAGRDMCSASRAYELRRDVRDGRTASARRAVRRNRHGQPPPPPPPLALAGFHSVSGPVRTRPIRNHVVGAARGLAVRSLGLFEAIGERRRRGRSVQNSPALCSCTAPGVKQRI
jgi:hypothetical protein